MNVCVTVGEALARYGFGEGHPFGPDRLDAFWRRMQAEGLDARVRVVEPSMAEAGEIERFHTSDYIARVRAQSESGEGFLDYGDTPAFVGVYEAAATVAGSVLAAVDALVAGDCQRAFVPIAGLHHARRDRAAGFCVFNDCGVAIEALRARHGIRRVAYVDIDAHHGDGVFYAFVDDPELIFADIHQDGRTLYPGTGDLTETGEGAAAGTKLNIPAPPGADDAFFFEAWERVEAFVRAGRPEFVILQCGADSLGGDPITQLNFTAAAHGHAAARLSILADECCQGRLLALGGGGYNRDNLAAAWTAVVRAMLESATAG
ncbi:acetoin utilization protein AcuC [Thiohalobacter sp. IOR34]|uniref:acetoin utilization protein AcuC n=1 Tax=Thiohalobacter sp. IOR34 TaxID=3057176 RepID=UPI0025AF86BA|nr:acetoin utilization protein AcuC [Thiohalobacter sp. IOR34]WJW76214.1 acetoin utilization protein AcuC [Thiohalobacter sp. IOR34]